MKTILLIDDDADIHLLVKTYLKGHFNLMSCASLEEAKNEMRRKMPDLILLDIDFGKSNGLDFYRENQKEFDRLQLPVIMLTQDTSLSTKLASFDIGAVDYVMKPFEPLELLARINVVFKRNRAQHIVVRNGLNVDLLTATVKFESNNEIVDLSHLEFKLLLFFIEHEGIIFTREKLIERVWGGNISITPRTVDQHVSKLRKKISDANAEIVTSHGEGYVFQSKDLKKVNAVSIDKELKEIVPQYLDSRKKEINDIKTALSTDDFRRLEGIGHRLAGSAKSYGFNKLTEIGLNMQDDARSKSKDKIEYSLKLLEEYLDNLSVFYN